MRRLTLLVLAVVLCLSALLPAPFVTVQTVAAQDDGYTPVFEASDCPFGYAEGVTCGYLTVPEDRADPGGAQIHLAVAILHAETDAPASDPIVYLAGGPGAGALRRVGSTLFDIFRTERDVILVDQRGTGFSQPSLACPEVEAIESESGRTTALQDGSVPYLDALAACRERLVGEGINLAAYTSASSAADFADLLLTLGIEQWNLFGASYGTRLAQTIMRDHPAGVRSAILDAVVPLEYNMTEAMIPETFAALDRLVAGCAADERCHAAFPDLGTTLIELIASLSQEPVQVSITHPSTGEQINVTLDGAFVVQMLFTAMYNSTALAELPLLIHDMRTGEFQDVARHTGRAFSFDTAVGMNLSVTCAEETNFTTLEDAIANEVMPPLFGDAFRGAGETITAQAFQECEVWDVPVADPIEIEPVVSGIPTLIINGGYDPITPPAYAEQVHANLPNSTYYEFPANGHGAFFANDCAQQVALIFLADPSTTPTDPCLDDRHGPVFLVP